MKAFAPATAAARPLEAIRVRMSSACRGWSDPLHDQGGRFPLVAPLLPVVAQWGKDAWDAHNEGKQDAPEILLPPGVEDE